MPRTVKFTISDEVLQRAEENEEFILCFVTFDPRGDTFELSYARTPPDHAIQMHEGLRDGSTEIHVPNAGS